MPIPKTKAAFLAELLRRNSAGLFPSVSEDGQGLCRYFGPNGRRCPVGCLIPKRGWKKEYDGSIGSVWGPESEIMTHVKLPTEVTVDHLVMLQRLHDDLAFRPRWPKREFAAGAKRILG